MRSIITIALFRNTGEQNQADIGRHPACPLAHNNAKARAGQGHSYRMIKVGPATQTGPPSPRG